MSPPQSAFLLIKFIVYFEGRSLFPFPECRLALVTCLTNRMQWKQHCGTCAGGSLPLLPGPLRTHPHLEPWAATKVWALCHCHAGGAMCRHSSHQSQPSSHPPRHQTSRQHQPSTEYHPGNTLWSRRIAQLSPPQTYHPQICKVIKCCCFISPLSFRGFVIQR